MKIYIKGGCLLHIMDSHLLKEIILEQEKIFTSYDEDEISREVLSRISELIDLPHILVITGLRRSGKSTLLKQIRRKYFPDETVYYFNFEDERLVSMNVEDMNLLYETFLEMKGSSKIFFLDEIQNIKGWEMFVRRLHDRGFKFFITGSNTSMLSRELGSRLTGRYVGVEVFPFSFREYMDVVDVRIRDPATTEERAVVKKAYNNYFERGGMPEYLRYGRREIIEALYDNILYRDILVRYGLKEERTLKELSMYLISNCSSEISFNRLKKMLNVGSVNTVKSYIDHLEAAYLLFTMNKYSHSMKKQIYSNKKVFVIDVSFIDLVSFKFSKDMGNIMENLVLVELKRRGKEIFFHKGNKECDFIVRDKNKIAHAIQVTFQIDERNRDREILGLLEAMKKYDLSEGLIITDNQQSEITEDSKKINLVPAWKWLSQE